MPSNTQKRTRSPSWRKGHNVVPKLTIPTWLEPRIAELDNFDEIKAFLDRRLDAYRNLVYSGGSPKSARADKAQLSKLKELD